MAYFADDVVQRLRVYSPWRKPLRPVEGHKEYVYRVWNQWIVAWGELDIRVLGIVSWVFDCDV